jgi:release factor glutamine methyltransferase
MPLSKEENAMSGHSADSGFCVQPGDSVADVLRRAPLDAVDTRVLLSHALGLSRVQLITEAGKKLSAEEAGRLTLLLRRRVAGEPVAYLTGEREFYGLPFAITPDVLIPRPETELLVELALERLPPEGSMLDLGTGSGAIAIAVAHTRHDALITAVDASERALAVARSNTQRNMGQSARIVFTLSNWYASLPTDARFDLIVANPPYIAADDPHLAEGDLRFEPHTALTDFGDGLTAIRAIVNGAASHLKPDGWLLLEHGYDQAHSVRALLVAHGFDLVQSWRDLAGIQRASGGILKLGQ